MNNPRLQASTATSNRSRCCGSIRVGFSRRNPENNGRIESVDLIQETALVGGHLTMCTRVGTGIRSSIRRHLPDCIDACLQQLPVTTKDRMIHPEIGANPIPITAIGSRLASVTASSFEMASSSARNKRREEACGFSGSASTYGNSFVSELIERHKGQPCSILWHSWKRSEKLHRPRNAIFIGVELQLDAHRFRIEGALRPGIRCHSDSDSKHRPFRQKSMTNSSDRSARRYFAAIFPAFAIGTDEISIGGRESRSVIAFRYCFHYPRCFRSELPKPEVLKD